MNCPDADQGAADFAAGKKDEARYNDASGGADYRRGWQLARLGSYRAPANEAAAVPPESAPEAGVLGTTPPDEADCPFDAAVPPPPEAPREPEAPRPPPSESAPPVSKQSVLLATGELKPRKPKPADPGQLGLF